MTTIASTSGPTAAQGREAPSQADQAKQAGKQLEAFFLRQLLTEARSGGGGMDAGFAGDTFKQMLDEAIADKMSARGIGLAQVFETQLGGATAEAVTGPMQMPGALALTTNQPRTEAPIGAIGHVPDPSILGPELGHAPRFGMPVVSSRGTSGYGERIDPIHGTKSMHPGVDMAAKTGTHVGAAAPGEIVHAGPAGTYGNLVTIRHADGFETRYAHLSKVDVKKGDRVEAGQLVGEVGSTGHSTGPHLHFEIRKEGKALDPRPYLPETDQKKALNPSANRATR